MGAPSYHWLVVTGTCLSDEFPILSMCWEWNNWNVIIPTDELTPWFFRQIRFFHDDFFPRNHGGWGFNLTHHIWWALWDPSESRRRSCRREQLRTTPLVRHLPGRTTGKSWGDFHGTVTTVCGIWSSISWEILSQTNHENTYGISRTAMPQVAQHSSSVFWTDGSFRRLYHISPQMSQTYGYIMLYFAIQEENGLRNSEYCWG